MDSAERAQLHVHTSIRTNLKSLHTCMQTTYTSPETLSQSVLGIIMRLYWPKKTKRFFLQIGSHGQREHLELISLRCFDKSYGADFRLTIQTLLMHRKHICLLPIPVVNNQQVRWGCVFFSPLLTSIAFFVNLTANMEKGEMPGV